MKSPLCYVGGKSKLSEMIVSMVPEHKTYVEVFCGASWVFFRKPESRCEIINDLDGDLVSLYRVLQNHLEEFLKQFKFLFTSREWWNDWKNQLNVSGLTDIQRAARYYYVQRQSFGGKVAGRTFGTGTEHRPRINFLRMEEELSEVHLRLTKTTIENLDYKEIVKRYDRPATFFYLDPPYYNCPVYKHNFYKKEDYIEMSAVLRNLAGKFVLSINDVPEMRQAFAGYKIKPITLQYTVSREGRGIGKELIVSNF
jgi:DNA adenine methylase